MKQLLFCMLFGTLLGLSIHAYPLVNDLSQNDINFLQLRQYVQNSESTMVFFEYNVKKEDTLHSIAQKVGISRTSLLGVNQLPAPLRFFPNRNTIIIPSKAGVFVSTKPRFDIEVIVSEAREKNLNLLQPLLVRASFQTKNSYFYFLQDQNMSEKELELWMLSKYRSPVIKGTISSRFGPRINPVSGTKLIHKGIDISSGPGTKIYAADTGIVTERSYNPIFGYYLQITHANGVKTLYGHVLDIIPPIGRRVLIGEHIAYMGSTGLSTGEHVHFEISFNNTPVDPLEHLLFRK